MATASKKLREVAESRYWRREDAHVVVAAWHASGDTLAEFAREWSLNPTRVSRWAAQLDGSKEDAEISFVPVRIAEAAAAAALRPTTRWVGEVCHGDFVVRVPLGFATDEMARLLAVVAEVERC